MDTATSRTDPPAVSARTFRIIASIAGAQVLALELLERLVPRGPVDEDSFEPAAPPESEQSPQSLIYIRDPLPVLAGLAHREPPIHRPDGPGRQWPNPVHVWLDQLKSDAVLPTERLERPCLRSGPIRARSVAE